MKIKQIVEFIVLRCLVALERYLGFHKKKGSEIPLSNAIDDISLLSDIIYL